MMKKRVYIYTTPFFPSPCDWSGSYSLDFVKALQSLGRYDVHVLLEGNGPDYVFEGVRVHRFPARRLPSNVLPFLYEKWNRTSFFCTLKRSGIKLEDVAVCHANTANYVSYAIAMKHANPNCLTLLQHHCLQPFGLNMGCLANCWIYNMYLFPAFRRRHELVDCHVFISEAVKHSFLTAPDTSWTDYVYYKRQMRGLGCFRPVQIKNWIVLHNGVDVGMFNPVGRNKSLRDTFIIGCVGHFSQLKNQLDLIQAVGKLAGTSPKKIVVRFVGSGRMLETCKKYIAERFEGFNGYERYDFFDRSSGCDHFVEYIDGVRCKCRNCEFEFLAEVRHGRLAAYYRSLDLFVLPSTFEGLGCVYAEAWACGTPFIACRGQGTDDWITPDERDLWLCEQNNPEDLAEKINYFMHNKPVQHLRGEIDIYKLVESFSEELEVIRARA